MFGHVGIPFAKSDHIALKVVHVWLAIYWRQYYLSWSCWKSYLNISIESYTKKTIASFHKGVSSINAWSQFSHLFGPFYAVIKIATDHQNNPSNNSTDARVSHDMKIIRSCFDDRIWSLSRDSSFLCYKPLIEMIKVQCIWHIVI